MKEDAPESQRSAAPPMETSPGDARLGTLFPEVGGVRGVFSSKVADYVAARPGYPPELYAALWQALSARGIASPALATVADIGSGTGLLTRGLLAEGYGHVFAVEPNEPMRATAINTLGGHPDFTAVAGSAEATTLPDASVDLITAAQAFHWFDVQPARRECLRILKPSGIVALIWNERLLTDPLQAALEALFNEFGGAVRATIETRDDAARVRQFFGEVPLERGAFPHAHLLNHDRFRSLAFSRSYMPPQASEDGRRARVAVDRLFDQHAMEGLVTMRYLAELTMGGLTDIS
jgi:SAM-dependent methyltransferase